MFIQFKDVHGALAMVRIDSIVNILVTEDGRHTVNLTDGQYLKLTQKSAQALADKLTEV